MVMANDAKLAPELQQTVSDQTVSVIVQYKTVPGTVNKGLIQMMGGTVGKDLTLINSVTAQVPANAVAALSEADSVAYISPDRPMRAHMNNAASAVLATYAWSLGFDGSAIGIAVIDSGIHDVDDLRDSSGKSRITYSLDLVGGGTDDGYGHGTHVAGIIGGNGKDSTCPTCNVAIRGIAPNVSLINLRALDNNGQGSDSTVIAAIQAAVQLKDAYNIRVINLSVGRPVYESYTQDPVCQAVEQAWQAGIVVVVSAGNDGRDNSMGTNGYFTIESPGNDPYVITVGAMNTKGTPDRADDVMTSYSSKGPTAGDYIVKPDLVAPGNRVVSLQEPGSLLQTYPQNRPLTGYYMKGTASRPSSAYFTLSGTSMATGVVSGAAALMLQQDPTLTPDQVKARMMKTAYKNLPPYTTVVDSGVTYYIPV
jgi:serine protease AprX